MWKCRCFQQGCQNCWTLVLVHTEAGHHNLLAPWLLLPVVQPGQVINRVASVLCVLPQSCHFSRCLVFSFTHLLTCCNCFDSIFERMSIMWGCLGSSSVSSNSRLELTGLSRNSSYLCSLWCVKMMLFLCLTLQYLDIRHWKRFYTRFW